MFESIREDLKSQWSRPNSGLQQLIMINVAVFLFVRMAEFIVPNFDLFLTFVAMPTDLATLITRPWTLITSFFTHYGFSHILWNMLYLYWFGMILRYHYGSDRLINLYILGGLVGSVSILALFNLIPQFESMSGGIALGASAGVFAVTVATATLVPNQTMHLLFFGPVKIKYIAAVLVVLSFLGLKGNNFGGELAHLSGALIGYMYIRNMQKGVDMGAWITRFLMFIKSFFVRTPKMKVHYSSPRKKKPQTSTTGTAKSTGKTTPSQAEIDAILDKISQSGYESLTKTEKEKLFNASKK
ncbi:MAG: rhomboid family intramembrane serine protease [Cyclobacteriaceae bacterium]|nr:rhomboid family intramembrane serine protease [Cyclobacteriaceae bacterium]